MQWRVQQSVTMWGSACLNVRTLGAGGLFAVHIDQDLLLMLVSNSDSKKFFLLFFLLVLWSVYFVYKPQFWPFIQSDGYGYHVWMRHLLAGDLSFCGEMAVSKAYSHTFSTLHPLTGICSNMYPPGVGIAKLPIAAFGPVSMTSEADPTLYEQYASLVLALTLCFTIAWLCAQLSKSFGASSASAQYSVSVVFFGSALFHYSSFMSSFSHVYSAFWTVVALATLVSDRPWRILLGVVAGAMLVLTRATNVLYFPFLASVLFYVTWERDKGSRGLPDVLLDGLVYRRLVPLFIGGAVGAVLQVLLNSHSFGVLTFSSYAASGALSFDSGWWGKFLLVLFSPGNGVMLYQPIIAVGVVAMCLVRGARFFGLISFVAFFFYLMVYSTWVDWHLGSSFAHRGFVELSPLISIFLAVALTHSRNGMRLVITGFTLIAAMLTTILMLSNWSFSLPIVGANHSQFIAAAIGRYLRPDQWAMLLGSSLVWIFCARSMLGGFKSQVQRG